jgi:hypothetical protein
MDQAIAEINQRLDNLVVAFLRENMVTKQEFEERLATLPTREDFHQLQISVDGFAQQSKANHEEIVVLGGRASRMEKWIMQAARTIGVEYKP